MAAAEFGWPEAERQQQVSDGASRHPLYYKLSCLNGEVNGLTLEQVRRQLRELGLVDV